MAKNYQFRIAPMDIWEAGLAPVTKFNPEGRGVKAQSPNQFQVTFATAQNNKPRWMEIDSIEARDALVAQLEAAIASLNKLDSLPTLASVTTTAPVSQSTTALPANVVTTDSLGTVLAELMAKQAEAAELRMAAMFEKMMAATAAPSTKRIDPPAVASGNGQSAAAKL